MNKCTKCEQKIKLVFSNTYTYEGQKVSIRLCNRCLKIFIKTLLDLMDYVYYRSALQLFSGKEIKKKG